MKALVVYESMFGNTELVARAIAAGLGAGSATKVARAPAFVPEDVDLLVVGAPTHAHGLSRDRTRAQAAERGALDGATADGVREWLGQLGIPRTIAGAAFDTRRSGPTWLTGSATSGVAKLLSSAGVRMVGTRSFVLDGTHDAEGRAISDAELERARQFGKALRSTASELERGARAPAPTPR